MITEMPSSQKRNVRLYTLGCKVNQYETQAIREAFERCGVRDAEGEKGTACDFVVLNTCTVTRDADKTNRYWIRRLRREHPGARLAVTGCFVKDNREALEAMPEVDLVFTNEEKPVLAQRLTGAGKKEGDGSVTNSVFPPLSISRFEGKTRAFVKIQDGCNHACSFCKVTLVRGRSVSRPLDGIREEVVRLRDAGYCEIVLTGIQLGAYGLDLESGAGRKKRRLAEAIETCAAVDGIQRVRLSSIELTDIDDALIKTFRKVPKLCPNLHVPLQSGDDDILKKMNRRYTAQKYVEKIAELRKHVPGLGLTVDVMTGFPGETEEQFERTVEVIKAVRPLKCHVFPYSRREGTAASQLRDLPVKVLQARTKELIERADKIGETVRRDLLGTTAKVLAEHRDERTGFWEGRAENYLKVFFKFPRHVRGCIIPVKLSELFKDGCSGLSLTGQVF